MPNAISKETSLPLFADDSKCFRLILGRHDGDKLQDDLNKFFQWSLIRGMEFNANKCKVLRVARIRSIDDRDYRRTPLFRTRLIRSPHYFEGRSNSLGFTLPLYASPVISKPRYFKLFSISLGTSK